MNPTLTRRAAVQAIAVGGALVVTGPLMEGCNASQWVQLAINDLPVILQIATSIISIVGAFSGSTDPAAAALAQKAAAEVQTDLQLVQTLVNSYNSSTNKNGVLQQIDTALLDVQTNLSGVEGAFHINDPKSQAILSASISSALVLVVGLEALIPAPTPNPASATRVVARPTTDTAAIRIGYNMAMAAAGGSKFGI